MQAPPTGALIYFAVSGIVAACSFVFVRKLWFAAAISLLLAPFAFVVVCLAFNAINEAPTLDGLLVLTAMGLPATAIAGITRAVGWAECNDAQHKRSL
jgi:hypothetical protein